jgi:hypothetical protein
VREEMNRSEVAREKKERRRWCLFLICSQERNTTTTSRGKSERPLEENTISFENTGNEL